VPASLARASFRQDPNGTPMPSAFPRGGFYFEALDPMGHLRVMEVQGARGLRLEASGLSIRLPEPAGSVLVTVWGYAVRAVAYGGAGDPVAEEQSAATAQDAWLHLTAPGIERVELTEGGGEGMLVEIVAPTGC